MYRTLALVVAVVFAVAGCGDDSRSDADRSTEPAPPPQFWSAPADTPQQQAAVAQATRRIDVCALLPRDTLEDLELGAPEEVTVGLDSCRARLGESADATTLTWHTTLLPPLAPRLGTVTRIEDVDVLLVPDRGPEPRACGATGRFPSGAAFYLGLANADRNPCEVAESLLPGMVERWRRSPPQGTSPDTVVTVLTGADPCAVRAQLRDTADTDELRLTQCLFRYRDETVTVSYDYRVPDQIRARATEEKIDDRPVFRTTSLYDDRIPIYSAVVGPELPAGSTAFVPRVPAVEVTSATDDVARDVLSHVLALFPL